MGAEDGGKKKANRLAGAAYFLTDSSCAAAVYLSVCKAVKENFQE
jgi:hypothetical protein